MNNKLNPMCADCANLNKDCSGDHGTTFTGCIYRNPELWIVNTVDMSVFDFGNAKNAEDKIKAAYRRKAKEIERLEGLLTKYPDNHIFVGMLNEARAARYEAMTWEAFEIRQRGFLLRGRPEEVTQEVFEEQLNVLPPLAWCTVQGVEMFCMSEMYTGTFTSQYAYDRTTGKYYSKMVDVRDRKTWINTYLRPQAG